MFLINLEHNDYIRMARCKHTNGVFTLLYNKYDIRRIVNGVVEEKSDTPELFGGIYIQCDECGMKKRYASYNAMPAHLRKMDSRCPL